MTDNLQSQRKMLAEREDKLHDRLAEITGRLMEAKAVAQMCEIDMRDTLIELNQVRIQLESLNRKLESYWHQPVPASVANRAAT